MKNLPSEILHLIFLHLTSKYISLVCKSWAKLNARILFKSPILKSITNLNMFLPTSINKHLVLNIDLSCLSPRWSTVTDAHILMLSSCINLKSLNLDYCQLISPKSVSTLLNKCKDLTKLVISGCTLFTDGNVGDWGSALVSSKIEFLDLSGLSITDSSARLLVHVKSLTHLVLAGTLVGEDSVIDILSLPRLIFLDLTGCYLEIQEVIKYKRESTEIEKQDKKGC